MAISPATAVAGQGGRTRAVCVALRDWCQVESKREYFEAPKHTSHIYHVTYGTVSYYATSRYPILGLVRQITSCEEVPAVPTEAAGTSSLISCFIRCLLRFSPLHKFFKMSFDRLNSLEAQSGFSRSEDAQYRDDPGFDQLAESLSDQLFTLNSNTARLTHQISLLGTKRDTERVRERVHNMLEETRTGFKDVGEGFKKIQTWEDVNVRFRFAL